MERKFNINKMKEGHEKFKSIGTKNLPPLSDPSDYTSVLFNIITNVCSQDGIVFFPYHENKKYIKNNNSSTAFPTESLLLLKENIISSGLIFEEGQFGFAVHLKLN